MKGPTISIIIPYKDRIEDLRQCLHAIAQARPTGMELVLVNDGEDDNETKSIVKKMGGRYILNTEMHGASGARNLGAKKARGGILVFLDSDVVVRQDFFSQIRRSVKKFGNKRCIQGMYSKRVPVRSWTSWFKNYYFYYNFCHRIKPDQFSSLSSHCFIIPKSAFFQVGGFSLEMGSVVEDAELGIRLLQNGIQPVLDHGLVVGHLKKFSFCSLLQYDYRLSYYKTKMAIRKMLMKKDGEARAKNVFRISGGRISEMFPIVLSICLSPLILLTAVFAFFSFPILVAFLALVLLFLGINLRFFDFLRKEKGILFSLFSSILYFFDMHSAFWGILLGCISGLSLLLRKKT